TSGAGILSYSSDGGNIWDHEEVDVDGVSHTSIDIDPVSERVFASYVRFSQGPTVFTTDDFGQTFDYFPVLEEDVYPSSVTSISVVDDQTFFVAYTRETDGLVYVSSTTDGGQSFNDVPVAPGLITSKSAIEAYDENTIYLIYADTDDVN